MVGGRRRAAAVLLAVLGAGSLFGADPARAERLERALLGLNGIITAPADPVRHVVYPLEDYVEVPGFPVSGHVLGLFSGTLLAAYRVAGGALDLAFSPLGVFPAIGPEPHYELLVLEPSEGETERER
jgi:hypothetical protein